jgi:ABC-type uncharacterized transport system auxiliary subunit
MNRLKPQAALLILLLLTQGCSGILTSDQPARQTYLLTPLAAPSSATATSKAVDLALNVTAIPGLDTDQILALGRDARLQQYSNARWPDHLPEVLTSVLQRSLEAAGPFAPVRSADRATTDGWMLQLEVREFFGIRDAAGDSSSVRVALAGSVSCGGERHPLSLHDANPVAMQSLASVVAAHQAGLDGVTRDLIERVVRLCQKIGPQ